MFTEIIEWLQSKAAFFASFFTVKHLLTYFSALVVFSLFWSFRKLLARLVMKIVNFSAQYKRGMLFINLIEAYAAKLASFIAAFGFLLAVSIIFPKSSLLTKLFYSLFTIYFFLGIHGFLRKLPSWAAQQEQNIITPFLSKILQIVNALVAVIVLSRVWGIDLSSIITSLGIGSLAIALAAQETLSDIFAVLAIMSEKPFKEGDWVLASSAEGIVEKISFRSTFIRNWENALISVPNRNLTKENIANWSKMETRRARFELAVEYHTPPEKITLLINRLKSLLMSYQEVDKENISVFFTTFAQSSLTVTITFFSKITDFSTYWSIREEINLQILGIFDELGLSFAFPSLSIYQEERCSEKS